MLCFVLHFDSFVSWRLLTCSFQCRHIKCSRCLYTFFRSNWGSVMKLRKAATQIWLFENTWISCSYSLFRNRWYKLKIKSTVGRSNFKVQNIVKSLGKYLSQQVEHMQVPNGTVPGVRGRLSTTTNYMTVSGQAVPRSNDLWEEMSYAVHWRCCGWDQELDCVAMGAV